MGRHFMDRQREKNFEGRCKHTVADSFPHSSLNVGEHITRKLRITKIKVINPQWAPVGTQLKQPKDLTVGHQIRQQPVII